MGNIGGFGFQLGGDSGGKGFFTPGANQTLIMVQSTFASSGTNTIHTVSAGKVAYLLGLVFAGASNNWAILGNDGTTQITKIPTGVTNTDNPFGLPPKRYESGEAMKIKNLTASGEDLSIWLWEQPAP